MNSYFVTVESRLIGAIGSFQRSREPINASNPKIAYKKVKDMLYRTREHVHVLKIEEMTESGNLELIDPTLYI